MNLRAIFTFVCLGAFLPIAVFSMSSTNYQIEWDSINIGGEDNSASANYRLRDTVGEHGTGDSSSESFQLSAGYRAGDRQQPALSIKIGTTESVVRETWTAFSSSSRSVTVSNTSTFALDDYIGVVENEGFLQVVAVGKVVAFSGNDILVDSWNGEENTLSSIASGSNDYVYRMNGNAAAFGIMFPTKQATAVTVTDIASNAVNGYTVTIQGDGPLRYSGISMIDVNDGIVSDDQEEYGMEVIGSLGVNTGSDIAIPTTTQMTVQQKAGPGENERIAVMYKLSTIASTPSGDFGQTIYYRLTGNF